MPINPPETSRTSRPGSASCRCSGRGVDLEIKGDAVHAVSQSSRRGPVWKHMAQMPAAARAVNLCPAHAKTAIRRRLYRGVERGPETRPACPALELGVRGKQGLTTACATEGAAPFFTIERARAARLRAVLTQHLKLLRRQRPAPLFCRFLVVAPHTSSVPGQEPGTKAREDLPRATRRRGRR